LHLIQILPNELDFEHFDAYYVKLRTKLQATVLYGKLGAKANT
jgi:hypothetical protein